MKRSHFHLNAIRICLAFGLRWKPNSGHKLISCTECKVEDYQNFCAVLCTTVVHNGMHTHMSSFYSYLRFMFTLSMTLLPSVP